MIDILKQPIPWYIAGPLIGLVVPALLILGNKTFGISSTLRHICAACIPSKVPFFNYEWKKELWNLLFVLGVLIGAILTKVFFDNPNGIIVSPVLREELASYDFDYPIDLLPSELFSWEAISNWKVFALLAVGGFLVGFGTRYAGGCTSGHAIMGLASLQWPSLVATFCFMIGGIICAQFILPYILSLL